MAMNWSEAKDGEVPCAEGRVSLLLGQQGHSGNWAGSSTIKGPGEAMELQSSQAVPVCFPGPVLTRNVALNTLAFPEGQEREDGWLCGSLGAQARTRGKQLLCFPGRVAVPCSWPSQGLVHAGHCALPEDAWEGGCILGSRMKCRRG